MEKSYQELCAEIEALKEKAEAVRAEEVSSAVAEVHRLIKEYHLTASDCGFSGGKRTAKTQKSKKNVPIKYRHPGDALLTWTGRGKSPKWLAELEAAGRKREEFLV